MNSSEHAPVGRGGRMLVRRRFGPITLSPQADSKSESPATSVSESQLSPRRAKRFPKVPPSRVGEDSGHVCVCLGGVAHPSLQVIFIQDPARHNEYVVSLEKEDDFIVGGVTGIGFIKLPGNAGAGTLLHIASAGSGDMKDMTLDWQLKACISTMYTGQQVGEPLARSSLRNM